MNNLWQEMTERYGYRRGSLIKTTLVKEERISNGIHYKNHSMNKEETKQPKRYSVAIKTISAALCLLGRMLRFSRR